MKNMKVASKTCIHPISCIAYPKDEDTLINSLNHLSNNMPDVEFAYIFHFGENGDKNHYHLLLRNNSTKGFQNTIRLFDYFIQPCEYDITTKDSNGNDIIKYRQGESVCYIAKRQFIVTNSLGDWYEYVLHNEEYFNSKVKKYGK